MTKVYPFPVPAGTTHAVIVLKVGNDPEARFIFDDLGDAIRFCQLNNDLQVTGYFGWHDHTKNAKPKEDWLRTMKDRSLAGIEHFRARDLEGRAIECDHGVVQATCPECAAQHAKPQTSRDEKVVGQSDTPENRAYEVINRNPAVDWPIVAHEYLALIQQMQRTLLKIDELWNIRGLNEKVDAALTASGLPDQASRDAKRKELD